MAATVTELTPENFIKKIKVMEPAERNKLKLKDLINLIVSAPLFTYDDDATIVNMRTQITNLAAKFDAFSELAHKNQAEIVNLKTQNTALTRENHELKTDMANVKEERRNNGNGDLEVRIVTLTKQINDIEQYLRINNLEIVGLPDPNEQAGETDEKLIINAVNQLDGLSDVVRPEDIDISHPLKTQRRDNKNVHVVRFISRKKKADILAANRNFKFRENDVFINEHLSPANRTLFASATGKKRELGYKFLWTRGGNIFMRKSDESAVISINCDDDLNNLV